MKTLQVKVKPNSRKSALEELDDGTWLAQVKAPPARGKANAALVALIARHFKVARGAVIIVSGHTGRMKLVRVEGPAPLHD